MLAFAIAVLSHTVESSIMRALFRSMMEMERMQMIQLSNWPANIVAQSESLSSSQLESSLAFESKRGLELPFLSLRLR